MKWLLNNALTLFVSFLQAIYPNTPIVSFLFWTYHRGGYYRNCASTVVTRFRVEKAFIVGCF